MARGMKWRPYVPQHERRASATQLAKDAARAGEAWAPVRPETRGRKIARTVWGAAWCENLERYHDYANRLPRGRTYLRNGSVVHLEIAAGSVRARVNGSDLYRVEIAIARIENKRWRALTASCTGGIASMIELLEGRLSADVMAVMTARGSGLFPEPREITLRCSCPDWASMCKHVAAVMYGIGVRLDDAPDLLFALRGVDPRELVSRVEARTIVGASAGDGALAEDALADIFGVELADVGPIAKAPRARAKPKAEPREQVAVAAKRATKRGAKPMRTAVITRAELLARGVPSGTIGGWIDRGLLASAGRPGVYRLDEELEARLAARGAGSARASYVARPSRQ